MKNRAVWTTLVIWASACSSPQNWCKRNQQCSEELGFESSYTECVHEITVRLEKAQSVGCGEEEAAYNDCATALDCSDWNTESGANECASETRALGRCWAAAQTTRTNSGSGGNTGAGGTTGTITPVATTNAAETRNFCQNYVACGLSGGTGTSFVETCVTATSALLSNAAAKGCDDEYTSYMSCVRTVSCSSSSATTVPCKSDYNAYARCYGTPELP